MTPCQDSTWMGWTTCASAWREDELTGASYSAKATEQHREPDKLAVRRISGRNDSCTVVPYALYTVLQAGAHAAVLITQSLPFYDIWCNLLMRFLPSRPFYSHLLCPIQCMHLCKSGQTTNCVCFVSVCNLSSSYFMVGLPFHIYIVECKGMCWLRPHIWTFRSSAPLNNLCDSVCIHFEAHLFK